MAGSILAIGLIQGVMRIIRGIKLLVTGSALEDMPLYRNLLPFDCVLS
jgi:hypothetical protein